MIFFDLINLKKLRKAVLYLLCLLVVMTVQGSILSRVKLLGVRAMIVPALIVAIGMLEDGLWGGMMGILAGALCDIASSDTTALYTVLLAVTGFLAGLLGESLVNRRFYSYLFVAAGFLLLAGLWRIVPLWIYQGGGIRALARTAVLQAAWSLPFAVPIYFAVKAVAGRGRAN